MLCLGIADEGDWRNRWRGITLLAVENWATEPLSVFGLRCAPRNSTSLIIESAQLLINALTGEVESQYVKKSGKPTNQDLSLIA